MHTKHTTHTHTHGSKQGHSKSHSHPDSGHPMCAVYMALATHDTQSAFTGFHRVTTDAARLYMSSSHGRPTGGERKLVARSRYLHMEQTRLRVGGIN